MSLRPRLLLLLGATVLTGTQSARADITEFFQLMKGARSGLSAAPNTTGEGAPRQVVLNGVPLHLLTGRSNDTPEDVVSHYERRCPRPKFASSQLPIRKDVGTDYAWMLDPTPFLQPAPLCMAYAYNSAGLTDYIAVLSDAAVPAGALSSAENRDAPGSEAPGVPRPHGAVRSFNLAEPAAGYMMVSYLMPDSAESAFRQTVHQLTAAGFTSDGSFARAASQQGQLLIRLERTGQDVLIHAMPRRTTPSRSLIIYMARIR